MGRLHGSTFKCFCFCGFKSCMITTNPAAAIFQHGKEKYVMGKFYLDEFLLDF